MRYLPLPVLTFILLLLSGAKPAHAAERLGVVSCPANGASNRASVAVAYTLRQAFRRDERYDVVDFETLLGSPAREGALCALATAEGLVESGRDAYEALDMSAAQKAINDALAIYDQEAGYVTDVKRAADALMLLGAIAMMQHRDAEAVRRIEQAIALVPTVEADWRTFSPPMRKQFQEIAKRALSQPRATLSVASGSEAAEIWIDGHFAGVTPQTLSGLAPGHHFVRLQSNGYQSSGQAIDIGADKKKQSVSVVLKPALRAENFNTLMQSACVKTDRVALENLAEATGVSALAFAQTKLEGHTVNLSLTMFTTSIRALPTETGSFANEEDEGHYALEMAPLLRALVGGAAGTVPRAELTGGSGPLCALGLGCHTLKKLTVGIVGGAALLAAGVGVAEYVAARNDNNRFRSTPQLNPGESTLRDAGRKAALTGDVLVFAGATLGATAGLLAALWYPTPRVPSDTPTVAMLPWHGGAVFESRWTF